LDADPGALEQLSHSGDRSDPHHAWIDAGDGTPDERAERFQAKLLRLLLAGDDKGCGAVVDPARVARRYRAAVGTERGLQGRELLRAGVGTGMLVTLDAVHGDELG